MNIKEIEEASGLTRANIRFYEKENLLAPKRRDNGYRDYSEEDLQSLKKIRLFRELGITIDEIRAVINDPELLEEILAKRIEKAGGEIKDREDSIKVCMQMQEEHVSYQRMNADRYLDRLADLKTEGKYIANGRGALAEDREKITPHPWKRYLARGIDQLLCGLVLTLVWNVLFGQLFSVSAVGRFMEGLASLGIMLLAEPFLLSKFATTPGKYIFGISVYSGSGRKLTLTEAFDRTRTVLIRGMGFGIPVVNYICLYRSYRAYTGDEGLNWDYSIYGEEYQIREKKMPAMIIPYIITLSVVSFVTVYAVLSEFLPPNRGELTVAEFAENYNYYVKLFNKKGENNNGLYLDEEGSFSTLPISRGSSGVVLNITDEPRLKLDYTVVNGVLTGISFEQDICEEGGVSISGYGKEMRYIILAYAGADRDMHVLRKNFWQLLDELNYSDIIGKDYSFVKGDIRVECDVEYAADEWFLAEGVRLFPKTETQVRYKIKFDMVRSDLWQ